MKNKLIALMTILAVPALAEPVATNTPVVSSNVTVAVTNVPAPFTANAVVTVSPAPAAMSNRTDAIPDPMVGKVLLALSAHLQSARHFRCDVSFLINSEMEGMKQEISATYALAAEKPNRLSLRYLKGMAGNTVVCNGKTLVTYATSLNRYEEKEAPKSFEQFSQGVGPMSGNMLFVDNLLRDDIYAAIMDGVVKASYAGRETVDGIECDHLKFVQEQFDWEMWVTSGLNAVVVQVLNDMSKAVGSMAADGSTAKGMKMTVLNRFSNWVVDGELPADAFEFKPPSGARKAESLFEGEDEDPAMRPVVTLPDEAKSTNVVERK